MDLHERSGVTGPRASGTSDVSHILRRNREINENELGIDHRIQD
jgi:hypothetical protein